jgi:hypothetical protein
MRTSVNGSLHTSAFRVAEFTFDPDFLPNHNTATLESLALYVQNGSCKNETLLPPMDKCLAALAAYCPGHQGMSFSCMQCALSDQNRAAVEASCGGNFDAGDDDTGWVVKFYCGIGWPQSTFQRSPMSEYCVEHLPAPQTDPIPGGDGYAQYISCNGEENDGALYPVGNSPRDPTCMCWT